MPKPLVNLSISSPGFFGLNKQLGGSILPPGWASVATNLIFDTSGRLSARKGYKNRFTSNPVGTPRTVHEYVDGVGNRLTIFSTNNKIYKDNENGTFTDITGTITAPTADNWQFANLNGKCVGFQSGHAPIVLTSVGGTFADIVLSGTQQPTTATNSCLAAFGRLWALDARSLKYSDLLDETAWNGVFDLSAYWKGGMDEGIAVAEYNGYLVVFGMDNTIIFSNPYDPASTMQIVENIGGIGCTARDSIQDVGTDMLFLSRTGVRSLGRTIQEKSMPIRDISKNVKDDLISKYASETAPIKSAYNAEEGFYLLSFPGNSTTYLFDLKAPLQDGSLRVTEWNIGPTALTYTLAGLLYMGFSARIAEYSGYYDDADRDGANGAGYTASWVGGWNDFGEEARAFIKIPKKLSVLAGGISGVTATAKWAFDYRASFSTRDITFSGGAVSRYGTAKYAVDVYSGQIYFDEVKTPMNKQGQVIKFGLDVDVQGEQVIIQRLDLLAKMGRYSI